MDVAVSNRVGQHLEAGRHERIRRNHGAALAAFEAAVAIDPLNSAATLELIRELRALDRLDEADMRLDRLLDAEPRHVGALIERGHVRRRQGNHDGAVVAFKAAVAADPNNRNIQVELARDLRTVGQLDEADATLAGVLDAEPRQVAALVERGHICRRKSDHAGAVKAFKAAAAADPLNRNIQVELARDHRALGQLDEADALLGGILDAEPGKVWALIERGLVRRQRGDNAGAAAAFEAAVAADPQNRNIQVELARDLRALGRLDEADALLGRVLDVDPSKIGALVERGHLQRQRANHAAALAAFEAAAKIDSQNFGLHLEIASALRALGRLGDAEAMLRKLSEATPGDLSVIIRLSHLMMDTN